MSRPQRAVTLILPVKETSRAKTRLAMPAEHRRHVALELARHSLAVAASCLPGQRIIVVTSDPEVARLAAAHDMRVVDDPGDGLNPAIEHGVAAARTHAPADTIVVVMVCDLAGVTVDALASFLQQVEVAGAVPLHVADQAGGGTTLVTFPVQAPVRMVFGHDSAARFQAVGCRSVDDPHPALRADLDTLADLCEIAMPATLRRTLSHPLVAG